MKKLFFAVIALFLATSFCAFAVEFSLSDNGFGMDANIHREGDNIRIQYELAGLGNIKDSRITEEQRAAISNVKSMNMDMLFSCSEPKMKMISFDIVETNGNTVSQSAGENWFPVTKEEDIAKLQQLCDNY